MPPAGVFVPAPALPPAVPSQLLRLGLRLPVGPWLFPGFLTLVPLLGAAAHWCLRKRRAAALSSSCSQTPWQVLWGWFPQALAMVEPQNRWKLIWFDLHGPCEHNHFLLRWEAVALTLASALILRRVGWTSVR